MTELHPFLQSFRAEHVSLLASLRRLYADRDWSGFFKFCRTDVLNDHEMREELFLFSAIALKAEIKAGGPFCMLYYGLHLQNPPLSAAASICAEPKIDPRKNLNSTRKPFYEAGSPVCIPIEDHLALEQIVNAAERKSEPSELATLATAYLPILQSHFEKEDSCLLPMSQSILTRAELDSWCEKAAAWKASSKT